MRSHVKMVQFEAQASGDYAISMEFLDDFSWTPTLASCDDANVCEISSQSVVSCHGDYCSVHLPLTNFSEQDLSNLRFAGSDLSCANFKKAKLENSDFSNSDLCQTSLYSANLRGANFEGADLSFADLRNADLRGANLHDVRFVEVEVEGARFNRKTNLPISRDEAEALGMIYCF